MEGLNNSFKSYNNPRASYLDMLKHLANVNFQSPLSVKNVERSRKKLFRFLRLYWKESLRNSILKNGFQINARTLISNIYILQI